MPAFQTHTDCAQEIVLLILNEMPENWLEARIDFVRHSAQLNTLRAVYIIEPNGKKTFFDLPDQISDMFEQLAQLGSNSEKGFFKKLVLRISQKNDATAFAITYDYDDTTLGFIGSGGKVLDLPFSKRSGID